MNALELSLKKLGKITTEEKVVLCILFAALLLWIIPSLPRSFSSDSLNGDVNGTVATNNVSTFFFHNLAQNVPESVPELLIILAIGVIRLSKSKVVNEKVTTITYPLLSYKVNFLKLP